ncbi:MAG: glycosyltransferase family 4 protein [Chloroflexota bacterium]
MSEHADMPEHTEPIKVLHIITRLIIGGAQETAMLITEQLDKAEFDVALVSGPQTGTEGSLIEAVHLRNIPLTIEPTLVREIHPLKDAIALVKLIRHIRKNQYAIVHTHSSKAGIIGRWAARVAGVPLIVHTVHGWGHHERQHPLVRWLYILLEKVTLPITDKLIVVSSFNIEKGLQDGIGDDDDYVVIRSGIELDRFGYPIRSPQEVRAELGIPAEAKVIGTVTRLSEQKAPLDFIHAAHLVAMERPDTYFVIVGDGPLRGDVEAAIRQNGLTERVILTGLRRDIPELMASFDLFALSSLWEGLPRVLPQAMASVLPLVATQIDGNAEIIQEDENGVLVPPGEPKKLAQALVSLLDNPERAFEMGQTGREMVEEYGVDRMVKETEILYRRLRNEKGTASFGIHI